VGETEGANGGIAKRLDGSTPRRRHGFSMFYKMKTFSWQGTGSSIVNGFHSR
jgi:hypothetical protein